MFLLKARSGYLARLCSRVGPPRKHASTISPRAAAGSATVAATDAVLAEIAEVQVGTAVVLVVVIAGIDAAKT